MATEAENKQPQGARLTAVVILAMLLIPVATIGLSTADASAAKGNGTQSIRGGTVVPAGTKTWAVRLETLDPELGWVPFCSGSLIAPRFVLTAAHCLVRGHAEEAVSGRLRVGFVTSTGFPKRMAARAAAWGSYEKAADMESNPQSMPDMGVVELKDPAPDGIEPIPLASIKDAQRSDELEVIGFGPSEEGEGSLHDRPASGPVKLNCPEYMIPPNTRVCWSSDTVDICRGDSGGALVSGLPSPAVVAVNVRGDTPCSPDGFHSGSSTRVESASGWLMRQTGESLFGLPSVKKDVRLPRVTGLDFRFPRCKPRSKCTRWLRIGVAASDSSKTTLSARVTLTSESASGSSWTSTKLIAFRTEASRGRGLAVFPIPDYVFTDPALKRSPMLALVRVANGLDNGSITRSWLCVRGSRAACARSMQTTRW